MDRNEYEDKMKSMPEDPTYRKLQKDPTTRVNREIARVLKKLETQGSIDNKFDTTSPHNSWDHDKCTDSQGRCSTQTNSFVYWFIHLQVSQRDDQILTPLVGKMERSFRDAAEFVQWIKVKPARDDIKMISFDVINLFTRVPRRCSPGDPLTTCKQWHTRWTNMYSRQMKSVALLNSASVQCISNLVKCSMSRWMECQ